MSFRRFEPSRFRSASSSRARSLSGTLVCLGRVGSTQAEARSLLQRGASHGTIVLAEEQTSGRGRRGRSWESPPGGGLWATMILRFEGRPKDPQWLTLGASLAVCESARSLGVSKAEVKWPNDVVVNRRKFAGILGELIDEGGVSACALLGLGVNVDLDPAELQATASVTSLRAAGLAPEVGREELLAAIVDRLDETVEAVARGQSDLILRRWRALSPSSSGARVIVEEAGSGDLVSGTTHGISPDGSLVLVDHAGVQRSVRFGGTLRFDSGERADATGH